MGQFEQMLVLLHEVGTRLAQEGGAYHRAWGRHLLEDWRALELIAQRFTPTEGSGLADEDRSEPLPGPEGESARPVEERV